VLVQILIFFDFINKLVFKRSVLEVIIILIANVELLHYVSFKSILESFFIITKHSFLDFLFSFKKLVVDRVKSVVIIWISELDSSVSLLVIVHIVQFSLELF